MSPDAPLLFSPGITDDDDIRYQKAKSIELRVPPHICDFSTDSPRQLVHARECHGSERRHFVRLEPRGCQSDEQIQDAVLFAPDDQCLECR